jgi:hypothetical protein
MESFDNRFTSQVDFNLKEKNVEQTYVHRFTYFMFYSYTRLPHLLLIYQH